MRNMTSKLAWLLCLTAVNFIAGSGAALVKAADDDVLKMTLTNTLPYPVDVFVVDENEDPPVETYKLTLPTPKKTIVRRKETIVENPKTLET